jgi:DNA topoisomerase-1
MRSTADGLGNTAAVARASYVHPAVVDAYLEGQIAPATPAKEDRADVPDRAEELEVARLLREAAEAPG